MFDCCDWKSPRSRIIISRTILVDRQAFLSRWASSEKNIYDKGGFQGTIFAEFASHEDRDIAVALLCSAGINQDGNKIWATQDRAPVERAARNFCFGLKNLFRNVWGIPHVLHVMDGAPCSVRVGGELAFTAHVTQSGVKYEWHGEWARWDDLQTSPALAAPRTHQPSRTTLMSRRCRPVPVGGGSCWGPNCVTQVEKVAPKKKKKIQNSKSSWISPMRLSLEQAKV